MVNVLIAQELRKGMVLVVKKIKVRAFWRTLSRLHLQSCSFFSLAHESVCDKQ